MKCKKEKRFLLWSIVALLSLVYFIVCQGTNASAVSNGKISIIKVDYQNSTITFQAQQTDTKVFFSDSTQKRWTEVPGELSKDKTIQMDISWISANSNYVLSFCGDSSKTVQTVTIPKQVTTFKAVFHKVKGTVVFTNANTRNIEWRKKQSSTWQAVSEDTLPAQLSPMITNGATIYFRLAPVNGKSEEDMGLRASKEISVTIPKKGAAPVVAVNGSSLSIPLDKGMAYRYLLADGTTTEWTSVTSKRSISLSELAPKALFGEKGEQEEVIIQFRKNASSTNQVSHITTLTIPIQEAAPEEDKYGIELTYTSSKSLALLVKAATENTPFEYTVVDKDDKLDYSSSVWSTISSNKEISLTSKAAPEGSRIYIRKKSITTSETTKFALASAERNITGESGVHYPDPAKAEGLETIISTAGVCNTSSSGKSYTFTLYSPTKTTVSSIQLLDVYGNVVGAVETKSSVAQNKDVTDANKRYIITSKIVSTAEIDSKTKEELYARITLASGEVITSTKATGVILYLYPKSQINNPTNEDGYSDKFSRIAGSKEKEDKTSFLFQLDFGVGYHYDSEQIGQLLSKEVEISSIQYDGYTLKKGDVLKEDEELEKSDPLSDYNMKYDSYTNSSGELIRRATVLIQVSNFESESKIDARDQFIPLVITLSNGEVLNKQVTIALTRTASLREAPIAWSIMEGSLEETKTLTSTDTNGHVSTSTSEVITYKLILDVFDASYNVAVSNVTWGGQSVLRAAKVASGVIEIELSNAKINKLSTASSTTNNLVITLSNGYEITSGCKLTILDNLVR